ncbi:MAG: lysophospholipid acyltransferase family protein [Fimbriimonadaceae bacterium]|nr:lysophospholipid acyltransferase family protein [Fimbriimonadaceae bacterium]
MASSKIRFKKRFENAAGAFAFGLVKAWMSRKTVLQAEKTGKKLGRLFFKLSRKHRERALSNLELAMPELSASEREAMALKVFEHYGIVGTDFLRTERRNYEEDLANTEFENWEIYEEACKAGGVLIVCAHFGNWERLGEIFAKKGYPIYAVARDADDEGVNRQVLELRQHAGLQILPRGNAAIQILKAMKQKLRVGLLPDQNCDESFYPFFGKLTGTVLGPATLHIRTGAPLVPVFCVRTGPGKYKVIVLPKIEPLPGYEDKIEAITRSMNLTLEGVIRRYPEQWLWFHDRWKAARKRGLL